VLNLLQDEFPDVTISKIRFLESQGLIDPERTPSGYRKFYGADIDRLRWILVQQRENFLPLKVIKERLEASEGVPPDDDPGNGHLSKTDESKPDLGSSTASGDDAAHRSVAPGSDGVADTVAAPAEAAVEDSQQPIWMADLAASKGAKTVEAVASAPLDAGPTEVSLTADELAAAAGISVESLRDLEKYGLVQSRPLGNDSYYDGDALLVASRSAAFLQQGIGARHLRMFKVAAEREAGFLEQVAMPLLKQRNPEARRQAVRLVEQLVDHGQDLRTALLRSNLRQHLDRS
jgi:DNA-binding transcriptional MerR regulator